MEETRSADQEAAACREAAVSDAGAVRYLSPGDFEIFEQGGLYRLTLPDDRTYVRFHAFRTYPLSRQETYISLRDGLEEIGIIRELAQLDKDTQRAIRELLARRYFVPLVTKIVSTKERYGGITWNVETDRGPMALTTKGLHEALAQNSVGRYFITDIDGSRYEILADETTRENAAWIESVL